MKLMVIFYVAYVAFFVVVIIYAALSGAIVRQSFCYFSQVPVLALNGFNIGQTQFVGFIGINNVFVDFQSQVLGLGNYTSNLTSIQNQNLQTLGQATVNAQIAISNYYPQ